MSERDFFQKAAKQRATAAIKTIESQTCAEIVVTLRHASATYRQASYLFGFLLSLVTLVAMLFLPYPFHLWAFPIDVTLAFVVGAFVASSSDLVRRGLTPARERHANVRRAAREAFVDHGVSRTSGRWGVLLYVSMLERDVELVADIGLDPVSIDGWHATLADLRASIRRLDFQGFVASMEKLGPVLAKPFPHGDDDVNELPDEIDADDASPSDATDATDATGAKGATEAKAKAKA